MIELVGGIVLGGVAGVVLKDKLMGSNASKDNKQRELDSLYAENEKYSKRNKDLERQVEDLLSELNKIQDELDKVNRELKNARLQNEELVRKIKDYKFACDAQEAEISMLKQKLG